MFQDTARQRNISAESTVCALCGASRLFLVTSVAVREIRHPSGNSHFELTTALLSHDDCRCKLSIIHLYSCNDSVDNISVMSDDIKSSAHIWNGRPAPSHDSPPAYTGVQQEDEDDPAPGPSSSATRQVQRRPVPRKAYDPLTAIAALAVIPYQKYNITDGTLSKDKVTVTVKQSSLYFQPEHLLPFILEQAALPPKPSLTITGRRDSGVDFDITLNLTHLIDLQNHKWTLKSAQISPLQGGPRTLYAKNDPSIPTHVASAVKRFCSDRSENKSFTLARSVEGLPTEMLAGQVRNLAAAIRYRGLLRIEFTSERSKVVVHKQSSSWLSNMLRLSPEQKYESVESVWIIGNDSDAENHTAESDLGLRVGHEWWGSWASTIRNAMIRKHKGSIGIDDWIEAKMGHLEREPTYDWGRDLSS